MFGKRQLFESYASPIIRNQYNIFQVRIYNSLGELIESQLTYKRKHAKAYFFHLVSNKQFDSDIAYAIILCGNWELAGWILCDIVLNSFHTTDNIKDETRWKLTLYDVSDAICYSKQSKHSFPVETIQTVMDQNKACYAVIACNDESQINDSFTTNKVAVNHNFDFAPYIESDRKRFYLGSERLNFMRLTQLLLLRERCKYNEI